MQFIIEWQFSALLISIVLLCLSRYILKNRYLIHRSLQIGFVTLLILPLISLWVKTNGGPIYSFYSAPADTAVTIPDHLTDTVRGEAGEVFPVAVVEQGWNAGSIITVVLLVYLLGALCLFLVNYFKVRRYCRKLPLYSSNIEALKGRVLLGDKSLSPFCFGLFRPSIVIPGSLEDNEDLQVALLHEKAHMDNLDPQFTCIQYFVKVLYCLNPIIWVLERQFNEVQEILADHRASTLLGDTQRYAESLINLVKRSRLASIPTCTRGMAAPKQQLLTRLNAIIKESDSMKKSIPLWKKSGLCLGLFAGCTAVMSTGLFAEEKERDSRSKESIEREVTRELDLNKRIRDAMDKIREGADVDGDGLISEGEEAAVKEKLARLQRRVDGAKRGAEHDATRGEHDATRGEHDAVRTRIAEALRKIREGADADGDGKISESEKAAAAEKMGQLRRRIAVLKKREHGDREHGDRARIAEAVRKIRENADTDGDGEISESEKAAVAESMGQLRRRLAEANKDSDRVKESTSEDDKEVRRRR